MRGVAAKKVRKEVRKIQEAKAEDIYKTFTQLIAALLTLSFKKRVKFAYCIVFKREYKP